jgi:threonine/homoserine/homoserine lactone efflux protein
MTVHLLPFLGVAVVVAITPGVDMALVTKNALVHGQKAAIATAIGVNAGIALWTVAAAQGIAAIVQASAVVFAAVKFAGAIYLAFLGVQALRAGWRARASERSLSEATPLDTRFAFRQGLTSNALNPKIAVFFTSLLPQFLHPARRRCWVCSCWGRSSIFSGVSGWRRMRLQPPVVAQCCSARASKPSPTT